MIRSFLFTPANVPRRVEKSLSLEADAVILDLEDSVPPQEKPPSRARVVEAAGKPRRGRRAASSTRGRLAALSCGATESSRSRITASASSVSAFATRRGTFAGVNRNERIIAATGARPTA